MVPGRKVAAIFGFCDIRSFTGGWLAGWFSFSSATEVLQEGMALLVQPSKPAPAWLAFSSTMAPALCFFVADATEVLQEDVMEFVNSIAQIVHSEVALHGGAANKNIGDAFLLVSC